MKAELPPTLPSHPKLTSEFFFFFDIFHTNLFNHLKLLWPVIPKVTQDGYFSSINWGSKLACGVAWINPFIWLIWYNWVWSSTPGYHECSFLHCEILVILLSQFPLTFFQTQRGMPLFMVQFTTILVWIGIVFMIIREVHRMISLNSELLLVLLSLEWIQVGINVYIHHSKYNMLLP